MRVPLYQIDMPGPWWAVLILALALIGLWRLITEAVQFPEGWANDQPCQPCINGYGEQHRCADERYCSCDQQVKHT